MKTSHRLTQYQQVLKRAKEHFGNIEKARLWMRISNPMLPGCVSPKQAIKNGYFKKLMDEMDQVAKPPEKDEGDISDYGSFRKK